MERATTVLFSRSIAAGNLRSQFTHTTNVSLKLPARTRRPTVRYRRYGWAVSTLAHVAVAAGLTAWSFQPWWLADGAARNARTIEVSMAEAEPADQAADQAAPEVRIVSEPADVTPDMVRNRLEEVIAESKAISDADKLAKLAALSERLNQVADERSVNALAGVMQSFLGTKPRATQPAQDKPSGEFDFDTAQFHDIQRYPKEPDGFRYVTILLDAAGRTIEVEVGAQEGEPVYETMQRIKANPLLEQVYRQIVMPLLDQLMAGVKQANTAKAASAEQAPAAAVEPLTPATPPVP